MMRRLTRRRQFKNRSKHSRNNKYKKTRRGKYVKKRRGVTRRRVLRGGVILKREQRNDMNCFFNSLHDDESNNDIIDGEPSYYSSYDRAILCLSKLYKSLGNELFIEMLGGGLFKEKYNTTFYNKNCYAKVRLIKFLSYIYDRISNGDTISQDAEHLEFVPSINAKYSAIPMLRALLCSLDGQCLNTTSYVVDFNYDETQGSKLLTAIYNNLTELASSYYIDETTRSEIKDVILPDMKSDNKLALNPTILCTILKNMVVT
jgi:hypothetical protein